MTKIISLLMLVVFTSACSLYRVNSEDTTLEFYPPKASADEVSYAENISRSYKVIGRVTVNTERVQGREDVLHKLKREAAILGGDAITNISTNAGTGRWVEIKPKFMKNSHIRQNYVADVIVYQ